MSDLDVYEAESILSSDEYSNEYEEEEEDEEDEEDDLMNVAVSSQSQQRPTTSASAIVAVKVVDKVRHRQSQRDSKGKKLSVAFRLRAIKWMNSKNKREKVHEYIKLVRKRYREQQEENQNEYNTSRGVRSRAASIQLSDTEPICLDDSDVEELPSPADKPKVNQNGKTEVKVENQINDVLLESATVKKEDDLSLLPGPSVKPQAISKVDDTPIISMPELEMDVAPTVSTKVPVTSTPIHTTTTTAATAEINPPATTAAPTATPEPTAHSNKKRPRSPSPIPRANVDNENQQQQQQQSKRVNIDNGPENTTPFYRNLNDLFPKLNEIIEQHVKVTNPTVEAIDRNVTDIVIELQTLDEMLETKEEEWNRLLYLKSVKEEILNRLMRKKELIELKEKHGNIKRFNLLELKELNAFLNDSHSSKATSNSTSTVQQLIENRANMRPVDLEMEKNNISRLKSLLFSNEDKRSSVNDERNAVDISKRLNSNSMAAVHDQSNANLRQQYSTSNNARPAVGRQGAFKDVKSIIADFRQQNPDMMPRVGKRIKIDPYANLGLNHPSMHDRRPREEMNMRNTYDNERYERNNVSSIPTLEKLLHSSQRNEEIDPRLRGNRQQHSQTYKYKQDERDIMYQLQREVINNEISLTPIVNKPKSFYQSQEIANKGYRTKTNLNDSNYNKRSELMAKAPQRCQECKMSEARFVCAGCENQWYCSRECQLSAWDRHSDFCGE